MRKGRERPLDVIIHADDFGITLDQSKDILGCSAACGGEGALNSTSALVTSPAFAECAGFVRPFLDANAIRMGLHLNLVEGPALSAPGEVPLLVDESGMFKLGFAKMLAISMSGQREELTRQVRAEAGAQIRVFLEAFPQMRDRLRVDSHQHFHLIPAVFDGLMAAVEDEGCTLEYLRIPAESLVPYMSVGAVRKHVPPVNVVKNALLNALWKQDAAKYPEELPKPAAFYGLALSGRMQHAANAEFLARVLADAEREGRDVELLFHPGGVPIKDACLNPNLPGFCDFYLSENRHTEAAALQSLPLPL